MLGADALRAVGGVGARVWFPVGDILEVGGTSSLELRCFREDHGEDWGVKESKNLLMTVWNHHAKHKQPQ